jgi:nitronate monooxygenase
MNTLKWPIIQGGMGVGISTPLLAKVISSMGNLGTLSGVAADRWLARALQHGDPDGKIRRALSYFPIPEVVKRIQDTYFVEGGIKQGQAYKSLPIFSFKASKTLIDLVVVASFVLVFLAKEACTGMISINYLEKVQIPNLYSFVGAMMAGVDYITMGAGIPLQVPGVLDCIAAGKPVNYRVHIDGTKEPAVLTFDPAKHYGQTFPIPKRPGFIPIISSNLLAEVFIKKASGAFDAWVVEKDIAGGHNAEPRGKYPLNDYGEPIYGDKDKVVFDNITKLGKPFWIGGGYASPQAVKSALAIGAQGIQAGSIFALADESGMNDQIKTTIRQLGFNNKLIVKTDLKASPTGFPFKVVQLPGTLSDPETYKIRRRICNHAHLATPYLKPDNTIGSRCPAETEEQYISKGGKLEDTVDRRCLCNGLMATTALGNGNEPAIVTLGNDYSFLSHLMRNENDSYSAADAINYLLENNNT